MKVLAIGDIVGENAVKKVEDVLPKIKEEYKVDFVIANGENAVKARGINKEIFYRIINSGIDVVTMGNHTYSNAGIYDINDKRLIVPINYSEDTIDSGYGVYEYNGKSIFVANILGKGLGAKLNGFNTIKDVISKISKDIKIRIIDFHSEFGNEKAAMAYFLKDKASVVYGTHTHIATADERILYNGLGFINDLGMCGPIDSGIGYNLDFEVERYTKQLSDDSKLSEDTKCSFNACLFDIDDYTGKTINIKRINI